MFGWFKKKPTPPTYPDTETWERANSRQRERASRSFAELQTRYAPAFQGPLFVDDDKEATVRSAQDIARRIMVLWAVDMKAEGVEQAQATKHLTELGIHDAVSPEERKFLDDPAPDPGYCQSLVWRLESIWVLLWAIGHIETLDWPSGMCNTKVMVPLLEDNALKPEFISNAQVRATSEILDQQDLIMRIHWAIRDAYINGRPLPANLNWAQPDDWVPANASAAVGVVEQRHHSVNWLVSYMDAEWDEVDTPT